MQFEYKEYETVSRNNKRYYVITEDKQYPSITTVLSNTQPIEKIKSLENWRNSVGAEEADRITQQACESGTNVHFLAENFLKNISVDMSSYNQRDIARFNSLKLKLKNIKPIGQEVVLFSDNLKVAGRCDCIGLYKDELCIIDFKTSTKIKSINYIDDYFIQVTAYAQMHNEMHSTHINKGIILIATDNGIPQEFKFNTENYIDSLHNRLYNFYSQQENI